METKRGKASARPFLQVADFKFNGMSLTDETIIAQFLEVIEAIAVRQIDLPFGTLLLVAPPNDPDAGAIYYYDRNRQYFYELQFEGGYHDIPGLEFDSLLSDSQLIELGGKKQDEHLTGLLLAKLQTRVDDETANHFVEVYTRSQRPHFTDELDS